ncbi:TPA: P-loop NTPase fold protein [Providencia rettgeri]
MNKHLTTYLDYYRTLEKPGYAVLVTGDWGCGKTYQIKKYFKEHEICYVSLFSINSIDDIYATVFAKMYPKKAALKKLVGSIGDVDASVSDSVTLGLGGILSRVGNALIKENVDNKKIIIFDDLERAIDKNIINISELLGVINNYIEHAGCKVIVIAHDGEIPVGFEKTKEKVIGQTIQVKSDINEALNTFLVKSELKRLYPKIKDILLSAFEQSGYSSLRVLKYIINDCNRLYGVVRNAKITKDDYCIYSLFNYFIILNIEFKHGIISEEELLRHRKDNVNYYIKANSKAPIPIPKTLEIERKYTNFNLSNEFISLENIVDIIVNGYFNCNGINEHIEKSNYFKDENLKPSWYKLMSFDTLEDSDIELAIKSINLDFENRTFKNKGDIFHLFNCMLLVEKASSNKPNYSIILKKCEKYVDDIFYSGEIEIRNPKSYDYDRSSSSYDGMSYWIEPDYSEYSKKIYNYLYEKMYEAFYKKQSDYNVLDKIKNDLSGLEKDLTQYSDNYGVYCEVPILSKINPCHFVDAWLSLPNNIQDKVNLLLGKRYKMERLSDSLKDEKAWLSDVFNELDKKASSMNGLHAYRIERLKLNIPTE